ncbi:hypothetical protein BJX61DRAFT_546572 [Aspergillus egyptiacus]|nr:hypothetical protein BJX61DRAFT_546572 [Aspergillus egyptiacus]
MGDVYKSVTECSLYTPCKIGHARLTKWSSDPNQPIFPVEFRQRSSTPYTLSTVENMKRVLRNRLKVLHGRRVEVHGFASNDTSSYVIRLMVDFPEPLVLKPWVLDHIFDGPKDIEMDDNPEDDGVLGKPESWERMVPKKHFYLDRLAFLEDQHRWT